MDLSRFSIDPALSAAAGATDHYRSVFLEKLLSGLFEQDENLYVKADLEKDRACILLFPALYWLTSGRGDAGRRRVLYLCAEPAAAEEARGEAERLFSALPGRPALALLGGGEADAGADLVIGDLQALAKAIVAPEFQPRSFGLVVADQADLLAELPGELLRTVQGRLLPSWERKTLVATGKHTPKSKNFAWDFADNPKEIKLSETMGFAGTMAALSKDVAEPDKIRFLLGLLAKLEDRHICVFCDLKSTAAELSARLGMNGVASDYIAGNLNPDRKRQIVAKAQGWTGRRPKGPAPEAEAQTATDAASDAAVPEEAESSVAPAQPSRFPEDSFVLVLTDEGAKGLPKASFVTLVNYDIPLEPELYFERLNLLRREAPGAGLYNLVCERYMYGVPAIERLIDASLAVSPLEDKASLPEDLSAGRPVDLPEPRRRDGHDRSGRGRFDHDDRRDDRRGGSDHDRFGDRPETRRRDAGPNPGHGRAASDSAPRQASEAVDPYSLSMEERMALYRKKYGQEKYGQDAGPAAAREGGRQQGRRGGEPGRRGQQRQGSPRGSDRRGPAPEAASDSAVPSGSAVPSESVREPASAQSSEVASSPETKSRGLLGRLQDILGAKKSD